MPTYLCVLTWFQIRGDLYSNKDIPSCPTTLHDAVSSFEKSEVCSPLDNTNPLGCLQSLWPRSCQALRSFLQRGGETIQWLCNELGEEEVFRARIRDSVTVVFHGINQEISFFISYKLQITTAWWRDKLEWLGLFQELLFLVSVQVSKQQQALTRGLRNRVKGDILYWPSRNIQAQLPREILFPEGTSTV